MEKSPSGATQRGIDPVTHKNGEGRLDLTVIAGVEDLNLQPKSARRFWYVSQRGLGVWGIGWINQHGNAKGPGH